MIMVIIIIITMMIILTVLVMILLLLHPSITIVTSHHHYTLTTSLIPQKQPLITPDNHHNQPTEQPPPLIITHLKQKRPIKRGNKLKIKTHNKNLTTRFTLFLLLASILHTYPTSILERRCWRLGAVIAADERATAALVRDKTPREGACQRPA